jgi:outer membrane receptor protein involved in Fe transport
MVDSKDIYLSSTDEIRYQGKLSFAGIFAQDEIDLADGKVKLIAGARMDVASYRDGSLRVIDPTSTTGFPQQSSEDFAHKSWTSFSPKLSGMVFFSNTLSSYLSFAMGFNPPKLDDLSKSGKISKGFKLANPDLNAETILTYEWGINWKPLSNLSFEPSVYFSQGKDFQYFVPNGDSIDTGGSNIKPVLQRQNISEVEIFGFEINARWQLVKNISLNGWYAYNHSVVSNFEVDAENPAKALEGKYLAEVPMHTAFVSVGWQNKIVNTTLTANFVGEMWGDEYNTEKIESYAMFDINVWKQLTRHWRLSLIVQDIFDRQPIDKKMRLSPGRYVMGKVQFAL